MAPTHSATSDIVADRIHSELLAQQHPYRVAIIGGRPDHAVHSEPHPPPQETSKQTAQPADHHTARRPATTSPTKIANTPAVRQASTAPKTPPTTLATGFGLR